MRFSVSNFVRSMLFVQNQQGHWRLGCLDGNGMFWYADKSVYRGQFDMNQRSGYGIYNFPDGRLYEGEWNKNNPHGKGQVTMTNGVVVCAEFADGQSNRITGSSEASLMPGQIPMLKANSVPMKESIAERKEDALDKIRALKALGALRTGSPKSNPFSLSPKHSEGGSPKKNLFLLSPKKSEGASPKTNPFLAALKKPQGPPSESKEPEQIPFKNLFQQKKN